MLVARCQIMLNLKENVTSLLLLDDLFRLKKSTGYANSGFVASGAGSQRASVDTKASTGQKYSTINSTMSLLCAH